MIVILAATRNVLCIDTSCGRWRALFGRLRFDSCFTQNAY